jgi:DNA-binding NarL/FixJ family response regulator
VRSAIRVLIADDHPVYRAGLRALVELSDGVELIAEVETGAQAVALSAQLRPAVVLMDLRMPDLGGIEATRQIVAAHPDIGILVLTMSEDDESVYAAMRAGARGYLLKGAGQEEILRAIDAVAGGQTILGADVGRRVVEALAAPARRGKPLPELTDREREVLELVALGWPNQRIAQHFVLSTKTVRNHVTNIYSKLRVSDRDEAIDLAHQAGLGRAVD